MLKQRINTFIALVGVLSVGIGASYIIISFSHNSEYHFVSADVIVTDEDR